ncbi:hypothetical protein TRAPUB_5736 [Trametes pubescens]|uniref:Uncharacterized protein n=1 Tax=Trametes pubescens TaxID=154538 RepID=A0A1M2V7N0_TRAPU|nr:hypothetical protein TRAPUB_5736 [Trametes pubescens]
MDSTRSLGTHSDSAEPPSSRTADAEKASLADVEADRAEVVHVEAPAVHDVCKDPAIKVGGMGMLMDGEGWVARSEGA